MGIYSNLLVKNIQKILADSERSAAWLAKKAGLPPATISRVLNKERSPNLDTIELISKGLGITPSDLLSDQGRISLTIKDGEVVSVFDIKGELAPEFHEKRQLIIDIVSLLPRLNTDNLAFYRDDIRDFIASKGTIKKSKNS